MPDPADVRSMFGRIAGRYDLANRALSFGADVWWRRRLVREVRRRKPAEVVDLATGSGDVAFALARALPPDTPILGLDFCQPMLDRAEQKRSARPSYDRITFMLGDSLEIPLEDDSAEAVTMAFGFRNLADRRRGLEECRRILRRPAGRLYVLEFSQPVRWFRPFYYFYLKTILPRAATLLTGDRAAYNYLAGSIESFPTREEVSEEILAAGFVDVRSIAMTFGVVALHIAIP
ncbi:MAG: ubiquinone/menaquinone biosynthesis methyltransferase [Puniceicoccaceae bacterium]|nr:MAG: ubiquinone/menaquinone biosynthesis methyltransferase [Puniceicoccaceae bacterium]